MRARQSAHMPNLMQAVVPDNGCNPFLLLVEYLYNALHTIATMLIYPPTLREVSQTAHVSIHNVSPELTERTLESLAEEVVQLFAAPVDDHKMLSMSSKMCRQYKKKLQHSSECMLPSYNHTLPSGQETGTYLALDLGGSAWQIPQTKWDQDNPDVGVTH